MHVAQFSHLSYDKKGMVCTKGSLFENIQQGGEKNYSN